MEYTNQDVRRQDRLLDEARAFEILKEGEFGILSMRTEEGDGAYGIPINYVWDRGNSIYIHCAPVGRKLRCIDACPNVSFCVTGRSKVIPDKFTTGYESIVLQCTAHPQFARSRADVCHLAVDFQILPRAIRAGHRVCQQVFPPHGDYPPGYSESQRKMQEYGILILFL